MVRKGSHEKLHAEKKCQFHHGISKPVTLFALLRRAPGQLPCNLAPIATKNVRSTMLCYSLHKEVILCPAPQCIMVRYRKGIRLSCPTREKLEHGPPPEHGTEPADGTPTGTAVAQRSETGQGILGAKEGKGMWVWSAVVLAVLSSRMSAGGCSYNFFPCEKLFSSFLPKKIEEEWQRAL
jgi:hypothetical protein